MFAKIIAIIFASLLFAACGPVTNSETAATPDAIPSIEADGSWSSATSDFTADISNGLIVIHWSPDNTSRGLFWQGTFPTGDLKDGQNVSSKGDTALLERSLYGSSEEVKPFSVVNGEIHFEFTIMQTTHQIALSKI